MLLDNGHTILDSGEIRADTSVWYNCHYIDASKVRTAGGPTETAPDANTLGGWQLDLSTELLYFEARVCNDWDAASDLTVHVCFEVYIDNTGGLVTDTVDRQLICYYKGDGDVACKTQTLEVATVVGQSAQYKQFNMSFTIDYDAVDNVVDINDKFAFILNLETDTSEVDDIMINHIIFQYTTAKARKEVS
jgi:hypothetical protein